MRRAPLFLALLGLCGCLANFPPIDARTSGGLSPGDASDPLPVLVVPSRDPASPGTTVGGPVAVGEAGSLGSGRPSSPSPTPSTAKRSPSPLPTATPVPLRYESASFFFQYPARWGIASSLVAPESVELHPFVGTGTFKITTDRESLTLKQRRSAEEDAARPSLASSLPLVLDQISGFAVSSNRDNPDGKIFVTVRGFLYRDRYFAITSSWDKRSADATTIEKDVKAIMSSFKWL